MTNEEILQKAIEKAVKNGWDELEMWSPTFTVRVDDTTSNRKRIWITYEEGDGEGVMLFDLIFSHDFAKAFWGEKGDGAEPYDLVSWRYHIQQMVLEPDPLQYLAKFL